MNENTDPPPGVYSANTKTGEVELEVAFVTTTATGGPHEVNSYSSGFAMGYLQSEFAATKETGIRPEFYRWVQQDSLPQADLLAMHARYAATVVTRSTAYPKYVRVHFTPQKEGIS
jgi:hypothetical protein